jgi:uncharacterized protein with GYD domain
VKPLRVSHGEARTQKRERALSLGLGFEYALEQGDVSMATYVILSRFSPKAFDDPKDFSKLAEKVSSRIKSECPGVQWKQSYATLGRFDVVDVVESDDIKQVERAAMIIRAYGHSTTETLPATPWTEFVAMLR